ncbi:excalibur calcium-binding domain-containing protein [Xanthomonas arboricola]|uniref:excalibur calcium-binding domain-containing protein n=1 Tax=Xanthomonas arboricola TaxID=56448 RepID=UPI000CEDC73D|nr:excalibur calcium-binding domain-containing protein [Xanthomonas arboricola]MCC8473906.1 excalibur calcium-binding domain-containing protein [Xanthomonas arboricola]PPU45603.1 cold-shock protein [Xanthomonas arboricola]
MRTHGTLTRWNTDRGFGFITPAQPGDDLFVHISAFPRSFEAPRIGEVISFETEPGPDGRPRAVRVVRGGTHAPKHVPPVRRNTARTAPAKGQIGLGKVLLMMLVLGGGAFAYQQRDYLINALTPAPTLEQTSPPARPVAAAPASAPTAQYSCGGRTRCTQMSSCAEATYVLQHCPNTAMDGDHDGVPCEDQWCR